MRKRIFNSIRFKLTLWYALILSVIVSFSGYFLLNQFETSLRQAIDNTLYTAVVEVEHAILLNPPESWQSGIRRIEKEFLVNRLFLQVYALAESPDREPRLIAKSGVLLGNVPKSRILPYLRKGQLTSPLYLSMNEETIHRHPLRILLFPLYKNGSQTHIIQAGTSLKKIQVTLNKFLIMLLIFFPLILVISSFIVYAILHRALLPVSRVVRAARAVTTEDLALRIDHAGRKDEVGALVSTFNQMIARLEKSVNYLKHFSEEVSHDLRTPLTIIRGEIETTLRKRRPVGEYIRILNSIHEEAAKLEDIITTLMLLAHIDAWSKRDAFSAVQLDEVVLKVFERMDILAKEMDHQLLLKRIDRVNIIGDSTLLTQMLTNVLQNAINYTPPGGIITIELAERENSANLTIHDNGIGIPEEAKSRLYERFYRVKGGEAGSGEHLGIGLTIVKRIVDIHEATIDIESRSQKGTKVTIIFPMTEKSTSFQTTPYRDNIKKI